MIKVIAGDFYNNRLAFVLGKTLYLPPASSWWRLERIPMSQVTEFQIVTEDNVKTLTGAVGWGAAGAVVLGPVGLLAGLLLGGTKKQVAFFCRFADGRKILGRTEPFVIETLHAGTINLR